jgi:pimeloyl-ACP methyl ester carboxylesterase
MRLVYIHGASATGDSFNYIRQHLNYHNDLVLEYDSKEGFLNNLEQMKAELADENRVFFICHSLGGIYALHLADALSHEQVAGAITLSTPYNGAESAEYIRRLLPFNKLFNDISPTSDPIRTANRIAIKHPWTNVVSTSGHNPLIIYPNDGVVTLRSMRHRDDMRLIDLPVNHYEIVLSQQTVELIKEQIDDLI